MEKTSITVLRDFDREGDCLVIWEESPPSWSYYVPNRRDYEGLGLGQVFAIRVPKGVRVEARNHYSIALYREA